MTEQVRITQRKSAIGEKESARGTLRALGLGRPGMRASQDDGPALRGMLRKVAHLVEVEEGLGPTKEKA